MSRRGNCHDNAVAESFFNLIKRERIRRQTYKTRAEARQDVFDYIEMFYNPVRKHATNAILSLTCSPIGPLFECRVHQRGDGHEEIEIH